MEKVLLLFPMSSFPDALKALCSAGFCGFARCARTRASYSLSSRKHGVSVLRTVF